MKKVIIVSKTHLDLGFTDFAQNIKSKYLNEFIPNAIDIAEKLNEDGKKNYVWTTGSWLIKESLHSGNVALQQKTQKALQDGNIAPHGLAFTTHSELMDEDLLDYNLSIVDEIDAIVGRRTIAAKMTDVPGHTKALIPMLAAHGIKLLHIGINGAAPAPEVPECFLWKCDGAEIVVIYATGYGGEFKCPYIDEILYFDNNLDNHGSKSSTAILNTISELQQKYPDYEVTAGRLDDVAESLWNVRDKLPVVDEEIGDSWIHGVATDPYKVAAFRTLCQLKTKWLQEGKLSKDSSEYKNFADNLLCICEHTWGLDAKMNFCDTENYTKQRFVKARKKDIVRPKKLFGDFPFRCLAFLTNTFGNRHYRYSRVQKSWAEQREYITKAVAALPQSLQEEAQGRLQQLRPEQVTWLCGVPFGVYDITQFDKWLLSIGEKGGVELSYGGKRVLDGLNTCLVDYRSYGAKDFEYFKEHYMRDTPAWAISDYLRPCLKGNDDYPQGVFPYKVGQCALRQSKDFVKITANLLCDKIACTEVGAPRVIWADYTLSADGLDVKIAWEEKDAVRSTESTCCHFHPVFDSLNFVKIGSKIDPNRVVYNGSRKLSVVQKCIFTSEEKTFEISSLECPLVATDGGNLLKFDNSEADIAKHGLSYVLHDNVWGTNFPLWYEDNAFFSFSIKKI